MMHVESGQVQIFLMQVDALETILCVKLAEACSSTEVMRNHTLGGAL